jgi:hypothetical protein
MLWRQGDVLIETVDQIPEAAQRQEGETILVMGEATGHAHRVEDAETAEIWAYAGSLYLFALTETRIVHDEHKPITLPPGAYQVWQQREYSPGDIRYIRD